MRITHESPEEERTFSLERLFVKYPETVLRNIGKDTELLYNLTWGFLNNRMYGAKDPFENNEFKAMTVYSNGPTPVLTSENCAEIFWETVPSLKSKYEMYRWQIDAIIEDAVNGLKDIEDDPYRSTQPPK